MSLFDSHLRGFILVSKICVLSQHGFLLFIYLMGVVIEVKNWVFACRKRILFATRVNKRLPMKKTKSVIWRAKNINKPLKKQGTIDRFDEYYRILFDAIFIYLGYSSSLKTFGAFDTVVFFYRESCFFMHLFRFAIPLLQWPFLQALQVWLQAWYSFSFVTIWIRQKKKIAWLFVLMKKIWISSHLLSNEFVIQVQHCKKY